METKKKINLKLIGLDGNAFILIGAFQRQAKKEGWTEEEIKGVIDECKQGDYNHLLNTLMSYCKNGGGLMIETEDKAKEILEYCYSYLVSHKQTELQKFKKKKLYRQMAREIEFWIRSS